MGGSRATFFGVKEEAVFEVATVGTGSSCGNEVAVAALKGRQPVTQHVGGNGLASCFPLFDSAAILGLLEVEVPCSQSADDIGLIESFGILVTSLVNVPQLRRFAQMADDFKELFDRIGDVARQQVEIPIKMRPTLANDLLTSLAFDVYSADEFTLFQVCFAIFDAFSLKSVFSITNENLYYFLKGVRRKCDERTWRHSIDVLQFAAVEVTSAKLEEVFSKVEILGLFIAALCHDLDFDCFTTNQEILAHLFNALYKTQSFNQMCHAVSAISILSQGDVNLFATMAPAVLKRVWSLIVNLILKTDLAFHFPILEDYSDLNRTSEFNLGKKNSHRELYLAMLLKTADMGASCRPYEIARQAIPSMADEFFKEGDVETAQGMEWDGAGFTRDHLQGNESISGFLEAICLQLFEVMGHYTPALAPMMTLAGRNLDQWKLDQMRQREREKRKGTSLPPDSSVEAPEGTEDPPDDAEETEVATA